MIKEEEKFRLVVIPPASRLAEDVLIRCFYALSLIATFSFLPKQLHAFSSQAAARFLIPKQLHELERESTAEWRHLAEDYVHRGDREACENLS